MELREKLRKNPTDHNWIAVKVATNLYLNKVKAACRSFFANWISEVSHQLQAHLDETDALDPFQSGFRPCHGTEMALVALLREADRGKVSLLVLLDISAAFDTVNHGILLGRLSELGIGGSALAWLRSFLGDHPQ